MSGPNRMPEVPADDAVRLAKLALRDQLLARRREVPLVDLSDRAHAVAAVLLAVPEVHRAATVAAYVSVGREPGTGPLLDALVAAGKRVVLPVLQPDSDLDWAAYDGPGSLVGAGRGLLEPTGRLLGSDAIGTADAVVVPALAGDDRGQRLGRGGGSYDRALARVPVGTFVCAVLNADERVPTVPSAPHDRPVRAVVTELGLERLPR